MVEAEQFEHRIVIRLGRILKKLISHTRNEKMVLYLHQLHLGTLTQHVGGISRVQGVPGKMEEITCLKEIRRTRGIPESQKTLAEATGFQIVVLIVLVALLYYLIK
ncbi:hypothetical protein SERLADRAFT_458245 [Serpula lacrymans var. lacrymans S7.9]|uniref:Uncharacterized protein n=1 Tax=Serpula lacrymans var. lacrymans (strain S7.9) TaxID=578457 RepID=F8NH38_SERL9|nr:uncharacterized protein SERLADRAFT_458245 [Serpula lacrymans var. lacrymans S7.9]EGO29895.1 hypothetical protein SERLADRAFT_458245 [Serpula lacrymans var. lacrymans S7.9]